jgi:DNA-directed RNA polymerase specialized sigma24 family protein
MIGPYYIVSVRNEARTQWRRYSREERCPSLEPYYEHSTPDFGFTLDRLMDFSKRLCKIDPIDKEILLLMAQGHTSVEIGKQLKKTPADVRKRIERARAELRALYDQEQRRAY